MSPFRIKVDPSHDASKVKAEGPGLARAGLFYHNLHLDSLIKRFDFQFSELIIRCGKRKADSLHGLHERSGQSACGRAVFRP